MTEAAGLSALREKVDRYLREALPEVAVDDAGDFMVSLGDSITWIRPAPWREGRTLARVWAITNVGVTVDGELTRFLVRTNAKLPLGGFRLDEPRAAVMVVHTLLGDYLNRVELLSSLAAVAGAASMFGPEIKQRFGGSLFTEG